MNLHFEPISLSRQAEYREHLAATPQTASDYSFINLWGWGPEYGLEWAFDNGLVWLRQTRPEVVYWAPVGDWKAADWKALLPRLAGQRLTRVPEQLAEHWTRVNGPALGEVRGHWDYVYSVPELIELKGNRFHKKKNLLNQFLKSYEADYREMDMECVEEAMDMQGQWCMWRDCESGSMLAAENQAIMRVLENWDRLIGIMGGALHVEGKIIAYTVADALSKDSVVIHFEKGQTEYKGVYQAINQMFLANTAHAFAWVNREQDLGDEGLRKAKLSYNPTHFVKKFEARFPSGDND